MPGLRKPRGPAPGKARARSVHGGDGDPPARAEALPHPDRHRGPRLPRVATPIPVLAGGFAQPQVSCAPPRFRILLPGHARPAND